MGKIIRKRLRMRCRPGGISIDRWINFVVGEADDVTIDRLRGAQFNAETEREVDQLFEELKVMARRARREGTEADFLSALDGRESQVEAPQSDDPVFEKFAKEWQGLALAADAFSVSEVESTEGILRLHLIPYFGRHRLSAINARLVDRYKVKKRSQPHQFGCGYAASTINNHLSVLRRVLVQAVEYELITQLPFGEGVWLRSERIEEDDDWLPPDEESRLFQWLQAHCQNRDVHMALLVQLVAGLRFSEVRALEKSDLDVQANGIHIRRSRARDVTSVPKNKRPRFQPLGVEVTDLLRRHMLSTPGQLLFTGKHGGHLSNNVMNRALRKACKAADVREIATHGLRRTAGSSYGFMGASQKTIAGMLGHLNTKATERYVRVHDGHRNDLMQARYARLTAEREG